MNGIVKNVIGAKQFGFIRNEQGVEYFFHKDDFNGHWDDLVDDVTNQDKIPVTFEAKDTPKGPRAANVERLDFPNTGR